MSKIDNEDQIDWSLTTFEGAEREAMRRWAALPLEDMIAALEEMQRVAQELNPSTKLHPRNNT